MNNKINGILANWGLQGSQIKQVYDTAWQVGEDYILKRYQDLGMLERNLKMLHILDEMHIPVGKIVSVISANNNTWYISDGNSFYFLSKKLQGENITQISNIKDISLNMGEIIAQLHMAFKKCEDMEGFWENSLLDEMNGWVRKNFEDNNWKYINREEYEKTISELADVYNKLPVQLIHRDVHFGNFLFADGVFSGYIDFDLSQKNIRIFDICYFLLGLLSEEEQLKVTEEQWFRFVENVFTGYENIIKLTTTEKKIIPCVMECIEFLFISYFENTGDLSCAEDTYKIYKFIKKEERRIRESIG